MSFMTTIQLLGIISATFATERIGARGALATSPAAAKKLRRVLKRMMKSRKKR